MYPSGAHLNKELQNTGLIAQDVQAVFPEAVSEIDDDGHLGWLTATW